MPIGRIDFGASLNRLDLPGVENFGRWDCGWIYTVRVRLRFERFGPAIFTYDDDTHTDRVTTTWLSTTCKCNTGWFVKDSIMRKFGSTVAANTEWIVTANGVTIGNDDAIDIESLR